MRELRVKVYSILVRGAREPLLVAGLTMAQAVRHMEQSMIDPIDRVELLGPLHGQGLSEVEYEHQSRVGEPGAGGEGDTGQQGPPPAAHR